MWPLVLLLLLGPLTATGVLVVLSGSMWLWQEKGTCPSPSLDTAGGWSNLSPDLVGSYTRRQFEAGSLNLMNSSTSEFTKTRGAFPRKERNIPVC